MIIANINVQDLKPTVTVTVDNESIVFGTFPAQPTLKAGLVFDFDNEDVVIADGAVCDLNVPFDCTLESVQMTAPKESGDATVALYYATYNDYPTFTSLDGGDNPSFSSSRKYKDTDLTGWTTTVSEGTIIRAQISGVVDITKIALTLNVRKLID